MLCSKLIPLSLLFFSILVHEALSLDLINHSCFGQDNYTPTAYSSFSANLNKLLNTLSAKVPPTGFGLAAIGQGRNRVTGLALCRGDASSSICKTCVIDAGKEIRELCPRGKGAIIWYDYCLLKYSNEDFFGQIDNENTFSMSSVDYVDFNPKLFNQKIKELLSKLSYKAYASPKLYAKGELELGASITLYGMAQCTRDLSDADCKECLVEAISEIPSCCYGKRGGRVVGGSCNVRYELYPFLDD